MDTLPTDADARHAALIRGFFLVLVLAASSLLAWADGGALVLQQRSGALSISVFATPSPLRVGPADFSLLIQDAETHDILLDGSVKLIFSKAGSQEIRVSATPGQAANKLLFAGNATLPEPGRWRMLAHCRVHGNDVEVDGSITVLPPEAPLLSYWQYFLIVPVAIGLFLLNQVLKSRRRSLKITLPS